jgi:protein-L-isoaspartate(D-aspartate) O-methyltransferase
VVTRLKLEKMISEIEGNITLSKNVKDAFLKFDREFFVPTGFKHLAYKLDALPMSANQWISSPLTVAKVIKHLDINHKVDSILEIGCGSGYQAAILSTLSRRIFTIERIDTLLKSAKARFFALGMMNIITKFDDGQKGWIEHAPYDRIVLSAAINKIPDTLFEQLSDDGILIAPIRSGDSEVLTKYSKKNGKIIKEDIGLCKFVPILNGTER